MAMQGRTERCTGSSNASTGTCSCSRSTGSGRECCHAIVQQRRRQRLQGSPPPLLQQLLLLFLAALACLPCCTAAAAGESAELEFRLGELHFVQGSTFATAHGSGSGNANTNNSSSGYSAIVSAKAAWEAKARSHLLHCFSSTASAESADTRASYVTMTLHYLQAAQGLTLPQHAALLLTTDSNEYLSHCLNSCSSQQATPVYTVDAAPVMASRDDELLRELALHASLALLPGNDMSVKNLAHEYVYVGCIAFTCICLCLCHTVSV